MITFLKYLGAFCLLAIAASLSFCAFGIYSGVQTANKLFEGADNYTCRQFIYDMTRSETDKLAPMLIAAAAYGIRDMSPTRIEKGTPEFTHAKEEYTTEMSSEGMEPALRKVYALCKGREAERVLNVFAQSITNGIVSGTAPDVSSTAAPQVTTIITSETKPTE